MFVKENENLVMDMSGNGNRKSLKDISTPTFCQSNGFPIALYLIKDYTNPSFLSTLNAVIIFLSFLCANMSFTIFTFPNSVLFPIEF